MFVPAYVWVALFGAKRAKAGTHAFATGALRANAAPATRKVLRSCIGLSFGL
jgi:hypothetical protein